ncbi:MAG: alpha/beta fold hydrolase [Thermoleophilaceae bacterium]
MRLAATLLVATSGALLVPESADAQPPFCGPGARPCIRVTVPLDRAGQVPGQVKLQVERRKAREPVRPPLVLLAGGPGQSSTASFDPESVDALLGDERRARDVYVVDQRGTGLSGALRCSPLQSVGTMGAGRAAADCATRLGPQRAFYTARDSADDLESVRQAIGAPRIALLGISYGTKTALAYAQRYPDRVDRLVLDSVLDSEASPDPLYRQNFRSVPRVLNSLCRGSSCRASTRNPAGDLERLAARIEKRPLRGRVFDRRGRAMTGRLTGFDLFGLLLAGDFDPSLRAMVPGLVRNALRGDSAPVLRAASRATTIEEGSEPEPPEAFSVAAYAAAVCEESPLPWARTAPPADRGRQALAFARAQPKSAFRPFGFETALQSDVIGICRQWPSAPTAPVPGGRLPDVPALLLEGEADLRTPVEGARAVAARMPRARVLVAPDSGHDTLDSDATKCTLRAARRFLAGGAPPSTCRGGRREALPQRPPPLSLGEVARSRRTPGRPGRTIGAVRLTVDDSLEDLALQLGDSLIETLLGGKTKPLRTGGLRGGVASYDIERDRLTLKSASYVPGVQVSGTLAGVLLGAPAKVRGTLLLRGRSAARGVIRVRGTRTTGTLAGRRVRDRLVVGRALRSSQARAARSGGLPPRPRIR